PCRTDLVIERAVVVTSERVAIFRRKLADILQLAVAEIRNEYMEVTFVLSRDERYTLSVRGKPRLHTNSATARELPRFSRLKIQCPQLKRIMIVFRVNDPATIARAIGLVIVTRPIRELLRDIRFDRLPPQRTRHRVHNRT